MCDSCGCAGHSLHNGHNHDHDGRDTGTPGTMNPLMDGKKTSYIFSSILDKNDKEAAHIREHLKGKKIFSVNMMSSPGSGKTSLLEKTAELMDLKMAVIEGDLETSRDADRIKAKGIPAYQITTGQSCHLDAFMVHQGLHHLPEEEESVLFIENVGNLVCPASYDLGTHRNIVILSVPEGDDKVAKYPVMFRKADLVIISKWDLHEHFDFSYDRVVEDLTRLNSRALVMKISTKDPDSIKTWINYLKDERRREFNF